MSVIIENVHVPIWALIVLVLFLLTLIRATTALKKQTEKLHKEVAELEEHRQTHYGEFGAFVEVIELFTGFDFNRQLLSRQVRASVRSIVPKTAFRVVFQRNGKLLFQTGSLRVGKTRQPSAEYEETRIYIAQSVTDQQYVELQMFARVLQKLISSFRLIEHDKLTDLPLREAFVSLLERELSRSRRNQYEASILFLDIDNFGTYNKAFGHLSGDKALKKFACLLRKHHRAEDYPARWGGEEFVLLLPQTGRDEATRVAENIRRDVAGTFFCGTTKEEPRHLTVSIGITTFPSDGETASELVERADIAMYHAKETGKNRVSHWRKGMKFPPKGRL